MRSRPDDSFRIPALPNPRGSRASQQLHPSHHHSSTPALRHHQPPPSPNLSAFTPSGIDYTHTHTHTHTCTLSFLFDALSSFALIIGLTTSTPAVGMVTSSTHHRGVLDGSFVALSREDSSFTNTAKKKVRNFSPHPPPPPSLHIWCLPVCRFSLLVPARVLTSPAAVQQPLVTAAVAAESGSWSCSTVGCCRPPTSTSWSVWGGAHHLLRLVLCSLVPVYAFLWNTTLGLCLYIPPAQRIYRVVVTHIILYIRQCAYMSLLHSRPGLSKSKRTKLRFGQP